MAAVLVHRAPTSAELLPRASLREPRSPASRHHRPAGGLGPPAAKRGRDRLAGLQRRGLQLPRAARRAQGPGAHLRDELRHRGMVHAYERVGHRASPRFNGMWAFAISDLRDEPKLVLSRDHYGIKPLYYARSPVTGRLLFASEIKGVLQDPELVAEPNGSSSTSTCSTGCTSTGRRRFSRASIGSRRRAGSSCRGRRRRKRSPAPTRRGTPSRSRPRPTGTPGCRATAMPTRRVPRAASTRPSSDVSWPTSRGHVSVGRHRLVVDRGVMSRAARGARARRGVARRPAQDVLGRLRRRPDRRARVHGRGAVEVDGRRHARSRADVGAVHRRSSSDSCWHQDEPIVRPVRTRSGA